MTKIILVTSLLMLAACSKSFETTEMDADLQKPMLAEQKAENYAAWHSAENNPDSVFSDLIKKQMAREVTTEEICQSFGKLSAVDLTMYENNLRRSETSFILKPCLGDLLKKLDDHWNQERMALGIPVKKTMADVRAFADGEQGVTGGEVSAKAQVNPVRRFDKVVQAVRDVSEGYFAVTGDVEPGQVALTFDDGPHELYTKDILKALDDANVKATFFVMGNNVKRYPENLRAVAKAGHAIGTHTQTHRCQANNARCEANNGGKRLTFAEAYADITAAHKAVRDVVGWVFPFFRFPYGESSIELKDLLKRTGVGEFYWSIDSDDWRTYRKDSKIAYSGADMIDSVIKQLKAKKRGQMLFHDIQKKTAVALPALLNRLYDEGFQPVVFMPADKTSIQNSKLLQAAEKSTVATVKSTPVPVAKTAAVKEPQK